MHLDVFEQQQESKWESPSFIIPKKDGSIFCIRNLGQLHKVMKWEQYPLRAIMKILHKHVGSDLSTKLDISM
jgi:hypothetical protein